MDQNQNQNASRQQYPESDPRHHTAKVKQMLNDTEQHVREDVTKINDPRAQALFETTAEVLGGLRKAYTDFEQKNEPAWQGSGGAGASSGSTSPRS